MPVTLDIPANYNPNIQQGDDPRVKELRSTCEAYETHKKQWGFYLDSYEGGQDFAASAENLFKHLRETPEDFTDRTNRAYNTNYCEPIIDFFTNFIFSETIDREGGSEKEFYQSFIKDVSLKDENVDDFMRKVCDDMQIFGMSYILVDSPKVDENSVLTKQDQIENNIRPYWVIIRPDEVVDWVRDRFGRFQYIKRKCIYRTFNGVGNVMTVESYTEYTQNAIYNSEIDVTEPAKPKIILYRDVLPNELDEIPIVCIKYKESRKDPDIGLSFLRDFAYNNREINNLTSLLQEFLYRQAFNILAKETETSVPLKDMQEGIVGTANLLEYPKGAKAPEYISPPAEPAQFIQTEISRIKREMYTRAAQELTSELFNGEGASGFSQAQSFSRTVPFISSRADILEKCENELMILTMKWLKSDWTGKVKYKDRYENTNFTDVLTQFQILVRDLQMPSEDFVKTELKRLIRIYDSKIPEDVMLSVDKQIDSMDFTGWLNTQKEALVGKTGNSPGEQQKPKQTGTMAEVAKEADNNASTNKLKS